MIHINLHNYRKELKKIEIQKCVVKAISFVGIIVLLVLTNWTFSKINLGQIRVETHKLEKAVKKLDPQVKAIQKIQYSQKRKVKIVDTIDSLREKQFPVRKIINDLNMAVPSGVWLDSVSQMTAKKLEDKKVPVILFETSNSKNKKREINKKDAKKENPLYEFIEITGRALEEELIAEYIKNLQGIPYYKATLLQKTKQTNMGGHPIYSFTAYSYMPEGKKKK